jgi:hypothetical protein
VKIVEFLPIFGFYGNFKARKKARNFEISYWFDAFSGTLQS